MNKFSEYSDDELIDKIMSHIITHNIFFSFFINEDKNYIDSDYHELLLEYMSRKQFRNIFKRVWNE